MGDVLDTVSRVVGRRKKKNREKTIFVYLQSLEPYGTTGKVTGKPFIQSCLAMLKIVEQLCWCLEDAARTEACISKPKSMDAALDMIRWCQHTRKAVSAIQKPGKPEFTSEKSSNNSPVVLGVGSTKSSMDNRLSRMEEYMEKMMSTVTSLVQEKSARQELSPTSRSPNQDNRSSNYSPRRNYGRGRGRRNNSTDRRQNRRGYDTGECFYCHKQGHYKRNCPDLWRNNNRQQTKQLTPKKNIQDERRVEFDDDNLVHDEQEKTSTGGTSVGTLGSQHTCSDV
ncbi:Hypothetical predicted protein [Mytilus galloprovincialis]|uniref:CCHC-type domain-containing protein n=1 Tax=Mytilus galloprovincialis TaxID=29158 RepID=A0A8B6E3A9_MYTGA|nr:Hypothetical predicted protein [Mytilus galloprovincialis]